MTDPTLPPIDDSDLPDPDEDEIVSAVLDGVATPDEVERVRSEPRLQARRAEFEAVRAQVAAPVPELDELTRRRLITAALAEAPISTRPAPLRTHPRWRKNALGIGSAAAVVVLALLVAPRLTDLASDDRGDAASVADEVGERESLDTMSLDTMSLGDGPEYHDGAGRDEESAGDGDSTPDANSGGSGTAAADPLAEAAIDLGTFADIASFEQAARAEYQRRMASDPPPTTGYYFANDDSLVEEIEARCGPTLHDDVVSPGHHRAGHIQGVIDGRRLVAVVAAGPDGSLDEADVVIVDPHTCTVIG